MIGIGVIGCGDVARSRYFPSIEALPGLELAGVYSRTPAHCEDIVRRHGGKLHRSLDSFLHDPTIEAVIIATPHPSHAELTVLALKAGKHVLTEKPMATSLSDAARVRAAAEESVGVFMALPLEDTAPLTEARRLIHGGAIGRVSSADAMLAHGGPIHAPWFFDRDAAGWGVLADLGIYLISQLTYLLGPAKSVFGRVATVFPERTLPDGRAVKTTVDDSATAVLAWPDDSLATIRANWCSPADKRHFLWETKIYGTEGIIVLNMASADRSLLVYSPGRPIEAAMPWYLPPLPAWDHHLDILRAFARAIARGKTHDTYGSHLSRQCHVIEIIAKLYESSRTGKAQELE